MRSVSLLFLFFFIFGWPNLRKKGTPARILKSKVKLRKYGTVTTVKAKLQSYAYRGAGGNTAVEVQRSVLIELGGGFCGFFTRRHSWLLTLLRQQIVRPTVGTVVAICTSVGTYNDTGANTEKTEYFLNWKLKSKM